MTSTTTTTTAGPPTLPDFPPIPECAIGSALNEYGFSVGRAERNLYWVSDGVDTSAFLAHPRRRGPS